MVVSAPSLTSNDDPIGRERFLLSKIRLPDSAFKLRQTHAASEGSSISTCGYQTTPLLQLFHSRLSITKR